MKLVLDTIEFTEAPVYRADGTPIRDAAYARYKGIVVDPLIGEPTIFGLFPVLLTNAERQAIEVILKDVPARIMRAIIGSS